MTFRRRIVVLAAGAVAAAIALASVVTFVVVRHDLRAGVDASLRELRPKVVFVSRTRGPGAAAGRGRQDARTTRRRLRRPSCRRRPSAAAPAWCRPRCPTATSSAPPRARRCPPTAAVREVASGRLGESLRDATVAACTRGC